MNGWEQVALVPNLLTDGAVEALACIYVGRVSGQAAEEVVLGEYEHAVVLVAQAELALFIAAGEVPVLVFSGPPLRVDLERALR